MSDTIEDLEILAPLTLEATGAKVPTFDTLVYNGGIFWPTVNGRPVVAVVDLAGLEVRAQSVPLLRDHDSGRAVGHTDSIINNGQALRATGIVSQKNADAAEVVDAAKNKFPWQSSINVDILQSKHVPAGQDVLVNGRTLVGPFLLVTKSKLREISAVALGGDPDASLSIAARAAGGSHMEQLAPTTTPAPAGAETAAASPSPTFSSTPVLAASSPAPATPADFNKAETLHAAAADPMAAFREKQAAEIERMARITEVCAGNSVLAARAIREQWTPEKAELEVLKASRPQAPSVHVHSATPATPEVLTAGFCMAGNLPGLEKQFDEKTLDTADKLTRGGANASLQRTLLQAARANGYVGDYFDKTDSGLADILRASSGFSTRSGVTNIFANVANKFLLSGYNFVEQEWRKISAVRSVSDFKTYTSYRLTDSLVYDELGPTGEIKHGELGEQSYTNRAKTYARMLGITREDIINDDLGAMTTLATRLGRGGALKLNSVFWAAFLNDSTLFSDSNSPDNLAAQALSITGLQTVVTQFYRFTDAQGQPLGAEPAILLVPPELEMVARQLMTTTGVVTGNTATVLNSNPYVGRFRVVVSRYLTDTDAWYLLADPADIPVIEVAFLNGKQTPTVETADVDFNQLGIQMRGYFDFGVGLQDFRGGVKSNAS